MDRAHTITGVIMLIFTISLLMFSLWEHSIEGIILSSGFSLIIIMGFLSDLKDALQSSTGSAIE